MLTEVAPKAPVVALNEKKLFTDAPTPEVVDEVLESTGKNIPEAALDTFIFDAVVAKPEVIAYPEVFEFPDVIAYPD